MKNASFSDQQRRTLRSLGKRSVKDLKSGSLFRWAHARENAGVKPFVLGDRRYARHDGIQLGTESLDEFLILLGGKFAPIAGVLFGGQSAFEMKELWSRPGSVHGGND